MSVSHNIKEFLTSSKEERLEIKNSFSSLEIGVLKETSFQENRVSLTPDSVSFLCQKGHKVLVESNAGLKSSFLDNDYIKAGAIISSKEDVIKSDYILKIEPLTLSEIKLMKPNQIVFSAVQLNTRNFEFFDLLLKKNITSLAFEFIKDKMGEFPFVRSMSEIAGKTSILIAGEYLSNEHGGRGLMFGGVSGSISTNVLIIGAGNVAEYACQAALGLGASITVFDDSLYKLKRIQTNVSKSIMTSTLQQSQLLNSLINTDVLITAKRLEDDSSYIISEDMVKRMKNGSVIIDVSIDQGGCCETSTITNHESPIFTKHGVIHYCVPNIASRVSRSASISISNILCSIINEISFEGGLENSIIKYEYLRSGVYTFNSMLTNQIISNKFSYNFKDLNLILPFR
ncbi:MAG: alanine dehydrogenase [Flavobacteriales bacterium]